MKESIEEYNRKIDLHNAEVDEENKKEERTIVDGNCRVASYKQENKEETNNEQQQRSS